eukprot:m.256332 g.256332  ORF g.256332 m.256332 type:complete len:111 (-) comp20114_c0_seq1:1276-1608(-)
MANTPHRAIVRHSAQTEGRGRSNIVINVNAEFIGDFIGTLWSMDSIPSAMFSCQSTRASKFVPISPAAALLCAVVSVLRAYALLAGQLEGLGDEDLAVASTAHELIQRPG